MYDAAFKVLNLVLQLGITKYNFIHLHIFNSISACSQVHSPSPPHGVWEGAGIDAQNTIYRKKYTFHNIVKHFIGHMRVRIKQSRGWGGRVGWINIISVKVGFGGRMCPT